MTHDNYPSIYRVSMNEKAQGAFLGAAVGDALGWPQEDRSSRIGTPRGSRVGSPEYAFQQWIRRAGGRFYAHEEIILPGEYSDDTQLLICTARSLLHGAQWRDYLTSTAGRKKESLLCETFLAYHDSIRSEHTA
jgi:ADP-ribosylglycohydrolase